VWYIDRWPSSGSVREARFDGAVSGDWASSAKCMRLQYLGHQKLALE
jgi:hypothetical protein